jgi:hypothetical protein
MKISPARQRNAVSQGIALGLCMLDRNEFAFDKLRIDLAFEHAWRDWDARYRSQFPRVSSDLAKGTDAVWVMAHADEAKNTLVLFWDWSGRDLTIYARGEWDPNEASEVKWALSVIDGEVPLEGWLSLARTFLADFDA